MTKKRPVGIIGAGSFGIAIAKLLEHNTEVLIYTRKPETMKAINEEHFYYGQTLSPSIRATITPQDIAEQCRLIFPIVPSSGFRTTTQLFSPFLKPYHILIHGTKGLDLVELDERELKRNSPVSRANIRTMSEVIIEETSVIRIGCLSGPNLANEILEGQPTATLVASRFDEVIELGKAALNSKQFHVFGSVLKPCRRKSKKPPRRIISC